MPVRDTSIEAHHDNTDSGLLGEMQRRVLALVRVHGPGTANELLRRSPNERDERVQHNLHARLFELRDLDVVEELETRACDVTGRRCIVWRTTGRPARARPPRMTKLQRAEARIAQLEAMLVDCRGTSARLQRQLDTALGVRSAQRRLF